MKKSLDRIFLDHISHGIDSEYGIVKKINVIQPELQAIKIFTTNAEPSNYLPFNGRFLPSFGSDLDLQSAQISNICEAYERYCVSLPVVNQQNIFSNIRKANSDFLSLAELKLIQGLEQDQLLENKMQVIDLGTRLKWIPATRLISGKKIFVPETMCVCFQNNRYFDTTTSGCAIGSSVDSAILSALYELIERDNFMSLWWFKGQVYEIPIDTVLLSQVVDLQAAYGRLWNRVRVFYYPGVLGIPTFFTVLIGEKNLQQPAFTMAGATNLNPQIALRKSLTEMASIFSDHFRWYNPENDLNSGFSLNPRSLHEAKKYYGYYSNLNQVFFLEKKFIQEYSFSKIENFDFGSAQKNLSFLKTQLQAKNFDPLLIDLTSDDVAELGLKVVRIVDKDLIDLNSAHSKRRLFKMRTSKRFNGQSVNNVFPHPYP